MLFMPIYTIFIVLLFGIFTAAEYDSITAHRLALFSSAAYCNWTTIMTWECGPYQELQGAKPILTAPLPFVETQAFAAVDENLGAVVLSFRGTIPAQIVNWLHDLAAAKIAPFGDTGAHVAAGFYEAYAPFGSFFGPLIRNMMHKNDQLLLYVTGHSLGGAMATLAVAEQFIWKSDNYIINRTHLFTFGAPRVGDDRFAAIINHSISKKAYRVTHRADPVPQLPLQRMGYVHSNDEVWYASDSSGEYVVCTHFEICPMLQTICGTAVLPFLRVVASTSLLAKMMNGGETVAT